MRIEQNLPLCAYTTFRVGGCADFAAFPTSEEEVLEALAFAKARSLPVLVMGNGSNLVVQDGGFRGVALIFADGFSRVDIEGERVSARAGALLSKVALAALDAGLSGFEFAAGIPGSVGGASAMNAGAYGGQIADALTECRVLRNGEILTLSNADMRYGYRQSDILSRGGIVLSATFSLCRGDKDAIRARMKELAQTRREKQPLNYPSAGSTFKRPEGHFAGKLIEDAGLKGYTIGGAQVSTLHAGFIINIGGATAKDITSLIEHIQKTVYGKFGVALEREVRIVGEEEA
ncbi:MAG: UDP-N-acetylmuramate dehydrogenase [Christensenellales bacterium]|jgi:UDP-N-acetylmuramate dehydrogenase